MIRSLPFAIAALLLSLLTPLPAARILAAEPETARPFAGDAATDLETVIQAAEQDTAAGAGKPATTAPARAASPAANLNRPGDPWPGPKGPFIFLEGEDLTVAGEGWKINPTPRNAELASSRGHALSGAEAGNGAAAASFDVPEAGRYRLWVRFSRWPGPERGLSPFTVTVTQGERVALTQTLGQALGNPSDQPVHWGIMTSTTLEVDLQAGPTKITLGKVEPLVAPHPTMRWIDCLLLFRDADYQPDMRDFGPQTYLRIHLDDAEPESVYFYCFIDRLRAPWYTNSYFDSQSWNLGLQPPAERYLRKGESSQWINMSRALYPDVNSILKFQATVQYHHPDASRSAYRLEFATAPRDDAIVKRVKRQGQGPGLTVRIGSNLVDDPLPQADYEYAANRLERIALMPAISFGKVPQRFPMMLGVPGGHFLSPRTRTLELKAMAYLGINGSPETLSDEDVAAGIRFGATGAPVWHMGTAGYNDPDLKGIEGQVAAAGKAMLQDPHADKLLYAKLMDEAGAADLEQMADFPLNHQVFSQWIQERKITLFDPADELEMTLAEQDDLAPPLSDGGALGDKPKGLTIRLAVDRSGPAKLWYYSQRFRAWSVANFFQIATKAVRAHYPGHIHTTQNFSDGAVYVGNFYAQGNDYPMYFRERALDAAMSEDWTNHGATHELCGWNVALLRAATRVHRQPIHMHVISSFGRPPGLIKLKAVTDISEGAQSLYFYAFAPPYDWHESGFAEHDGHYPAIAEISREVGAAEHILVGAKPRQAKTAILYSIPDDIWSVGADNTQGIERMLTYLALRHSQTPVDVLYDEDINEKELADYQVAYAFGAAWPREVVEPLAQWVRGGGTLVLSPGAITRNRFNETMPLLDKALGLSRPPAVSLQKLFAASMIHCRDMKAHDRVQLLDAKGEKTGESDLLATRQALTAPPEATVLARFPDGSPAAISQGVGSGRVILVGFMPAQAYMQGAWVPFQGDGRNELVAPLATVAQTMVILGKSEETDPAKIRVPMGRHIACPTEYDQALRRFINLPVNLAGVTPPVQADASPLEATFMEGPAGWVVPLANYTGKPLEKLTLTLRPGKVSGPIRSARLGVLAPTTTADGALLVSLPLESTDFVFATWKN